MPHALTRTAFLCLALVPSVSAAEELCVACSEPAAAYRCAFAGDGPGSPPEPGLQLLCIREIATKGGHKSCTIERGRTGSACDGPLIAIDRPANPAPALPKPATASATPTPAPNDQADSHAPRTMEELAKITAEQSKKDWDETQAKMKQTTEQTGHEIKKAGSAVGDAVKKSWNCVVSLFSSC